MKKLLGTAILALAALGATSFANASDKGLTYYRLLSDPNALRMIDVIQPPRAFHVKGVATSTGIQWSNKVEGNGKLCADGKDWLGLNDGSIHASTDGVKPTGPYLTGCKSGTMFTPSSRDVAQP